MALLNCPECNGSVSSLATSCPHCGCPFVVQPEEPAPSSDSVGFIAYQSPPRRTVRPKTQTIQRTSKTWKGNMPFGAIVAIVGCAMFQIAVYDKARGDDFRRPGIITCIVGVAWFLFARIGAWWNHG